jgi:hypothetical protein
MERGKFKSLRPDNNRDGYAEHKRDEVEPKDSLNHLSGG